MFYIYHCLNLTAIKQRTVTTILCKIKTLGYEILFDLQKTKMNYTAYISGIQNSDEFYLGNFQVNAQSQINSFIKVKFKNVIT